MFVKVIAGFLWAAVVALLVAILFKVIPWDSATKTVFWVLFFLAFITLGAGKTPKARPLVLPFDSEHIQVSMAGKIYKGKQVSALRLAGGGILINVDPMAREKVDETINTTKKPQKVTRA
jgi:hypothetical protein